MTFSMGMFSVHDPSASLLQYHYTSDEVRGGDGVNEVDGDSIYRLASVSKLFTVLASHLSFNAGEWDRPITDFVPRLSPPDVDNVGEESTPDSESHGLPPLDAQDPKLRAACLSEKFLEDPLAGRSPDEYMEGAWNRPPALRSWQGPAYSNHGFTLLGIALANITGKPIADVYPDLIFGPLGMTHSQSVPPAPSSFPAQPSHPGPDQEVSRCRLGGGAFLLAQRSSQVWNRIDEFDSTPTEQEPTVDEASLSHGQPPLLCRLSVGDIRLRPPRHRGRDGHLHYTKLGDSANFSSLLVLRPDHDAGFSVTSAASQRALKSVLHSALADLITDNGEQSTSSASHIHNSHQQRQQQQQQRHESIKPEET